HLDRMHHRCDTITIREIRTGPFLQHELYKTKVVVADGKDERTSEALTSLRSIKEIRLRDGDLGTQQKWVRQRVIIQNKSITKWITDKKILLDFRKLEMVRYPAVVPHECSHYVSIPLVFHFRVKISVIV
ncbi:hypothetical protein EGW08_002601, partial [Elysia chlorotica]